MLLFCMSTTITRFQLTANYCVKSHPTVVVDADHPLLQWLYFSFDLLCVTNVSDLISSLQHQSLLPKIGRLSIHSFTTMLMLASSMLQDICC